ncbi:MAG: hypothetical protein Q4A86_03035, partial [Clostridia bacterium]|nr:hypothetical protein [Clostridia bacterium]
LGYITCIILYIFPWLSLKVLKYPLALLLEAVKLTVNIFGDRRFSYEFSPEDLSSGLAAVYFGSALMIYMLLKAFHDIRQEKEIAAEKSDR